MTIVVHPSLKVKSGNVLETSLSERSEAMVAFSVGRSTPIDQRTLPAIDGAGLTEDEFFRINGFGNRAKVAYAASMLDADAIELAQVERRARMDGLRAVLRDRPAAPPLAPVVAAEACCDHAEPAPCSACVGDITSNEVTEDDDIPSDEEREAKHRELMPEYFDAREVEEAREAERWAQKCAIPAFKITDDFGEVDFSAGPDLTLEKAIADELARIERSPGMFTAERVVWKGSNVMAVIGKRSDGSAFVTMLDETDEDDEDQEPATLKLPELIASEAARMRRMETGAGDLMAVALEELARVVRTLGALTPAEVDARLEVLERDYVEHAASWEPELTPAGRFA